jgi:hypothetical protein
MIVPNECICAEWISGKRRVHGSQALRLIDAECLTVAPAEQLEVLTAAYEIVVKWIEGQEHTDSAVRLSVQDEQVSI